MLHPHERCYQHDVPLNQSNSIGKAEVQTRRPASSHVGKPGGTERAFRESQGELDWTARLDGGKTMVRG